MKGESESHSGSQREVRKRPSRAETGTCCMTPGFALYHTARSPAVKHSE